MFLSALLRSDQAIMLVVVSIWLALMLFAALIMLGVSLTIRRKIVVIPFLLVAPAVVFWTAYVPGAGFVGGKENAAATVIYLTLVAGGSIGVGLAKPVRQWWSERRG